MSKDLDVTKQISRSKVPFRHFGKIAAGGDFGHGAWRIITCF